MRKMEDQLRQAQKMESVGRLAGGIAHDFNNMLSVILGNTDIMLEDLDPDSPVIPNLIQIQNAAARSTNLTRQLLAFARKQTISPIVLDLNETIEGMLKMLGRLIGEGIELCWLPQKNLWKVKMDPSQVDQLLANLCVNARDAVTTIGKVTIETDNLKFDEDYCREHEGSRPGEYIMIAVSDNGSGMDKATLEKIFEPFFTSKGMGDGTGLGLATVYGIVKQNKGFINVYSEPEMGTTFRIYLPRDATRTIQSAAPDLKEPNLGGNEVILLVEDDKSILSITAETLERLGYRVLSTTSPSEAIRIGESHTDEINLIVTDVVMPEMNGKDLATKLESIHPNIKCLYMSGYTANVIAHHGVLDKGVNFINKPFSKQDLALKIRAVLDG
jgi:CheY-like chemotaxis protein